jgi:hypothetical protein
MAGTEPDLVLTGGLLLQRPPGRVRLMAPLEKKGCYVLILDVTKDHWNEIVRAAEVVGEVPK